MKRIRISKLLALLSLVASSLRAEPSEKAQKVNELISKNVCLIVVLNKNLSSSSTDGYTNSMNSYGPRVTRVIPIHSEVVLENGVIEIPNIVAVQAKQRADWLRTIKHNVKENVLRITFEHLSSERNETAGTVEIVEKKDSKGDGTLSDNVLDIVQFPITPLANLKVMIENTGNVKYWNNFPTDVTFTLVCQER